MQEQKWPDTIWVVRHGESAGNVAMREAHAKNSHVIEIAQRDADVPLSPLGMRQACALGRWFGQMPAERKPTVALSSPYLRAKRTAELVLECAGLDPDEVPIISDERLREREFGILDRLTTLGVASRHPDLSEMRTSLGKFYFRPPGGESWCDVILRLRSVIDTITRDYCQERVLIVCHTVVVLCFRYLFECLDEGEVLKIDRENNVANCSVTSYHYDPTPCKRGQMKLDRFNFVAPLEEAGEEVTREPDVPVAPK